MDDPSPEQPPVNRLALLAILTGVALAGLDTAIANTALPAIAADLKAEPAASIWVINAYQLAVVALLLPCAALGDKLGARRVYGWGLAVFTVASLACAVSGTLGQLAAARTLQGVGAAAMMAVNIALIRSIYPAHRLGRGVGLNALVVGVSFAAGPSLASAVLAVADWPWLFAINGPLGLLAMVLARQALPRPAPRQVAFDPVAALWTALCFALLAGALAAAAQREPLGWVLVALVLSAGFGGLVLRRQAGHPSPMLPVDLLRRPMFALSALTSMASFTTQGLAFVALPFHFQGVLHRDAVEIGLLMTPWAIVVAAAAPLAGRLSDRYAPGLLGGVGLAILSAGMAALALMPETAGPLDIGWRMGVCGMGFALFQSPNIRALMSSAPPERSGGASGVVAMARLLGQTSGAALVALCFGLAGPRGTTWALLLGVLSAALASGASFARLRVR
jgi:DHA2 family multidrug resistance protein-like MFS transporter